MGVELTRSEVEKISLQDPLPPVRGRRILPAVEDDGFDLHDGKSAQGGGGPQLPMLMAQNHVLSPDRTLPFDLHRSVQSARPILAPCLAL